MKRVLVAAAALTITALFVQPSTLAQQPASVLQFHALSNDDLRSWDAYVTQKTRSGELRARSVERDALLPSHTIERLQQFHEGVPIWGAEVVRDSENGVSHAIFGAVSPDFALSVEPSLSLDASRVALLQLLGPGAVLLKSPQLVVLRLEATGEYRLAYSAPVSGEGTVIRAFVDAGTGAELLRYSEIETQAAVGTGRGVLGDTKKLSVLGRAGAFVADDQLRPPVLTTFDMRGNLARAINVLDGASLFASDVASDTDNVWTDPAVVDAHVHVGWTYDFYFKRFGRRGLDNHDRPVVILANAVTQQGALSLSGNDLNFAINAFWCDDCGPGSVGTMFFGNGIPPGFVVSSSGRNYTYFSGALDIVAHELTHGVTASSSRLIYQGESGALNESFSDMMGKSVEFFYHPAGSGVGQADYTLGKDISRALRPGALNGDRSMANPGLYGDPDHYSRRYTGTADNGGVHTNSGISNQAFYLAIEGGTNRTSGVSVQGVGAANREQIEKVFYRAFTLLMPASSSFSTARVATAQAARDLYGAGGPVERAITQAWSAVGVFEQPTLNFSFSPSPVTARTTGCGSLASPCWPFRVTVQEASGLPLTVSASSIRFYDNNQAFINANNISFSQFYASCGPGTSRIPARGVACLDVVISLGGRSSGYVAFTVDGRDDNGSNLSFVSGLQRLSPTTGGFVPTTTFVEPGAMLDLVQAAGR